MGATGRAVVLPWLVVALVAAFATSGVVGTVAQLVPAPSEGAGGFALAVPSSVVVSPAYAPAAGVTDLGPVGPSTSISLVVGLASADPAGLASFVNATEVPGLPTYRQFLSAAVADARFGAEPNAAAAAEGYFESFGLAAVAHPDGLLLAVSGPAQSVGRAFGTSFDLYRTATGATFVSHPNVARLPPVAPWTGVLGLDTSPSFEPAVEASPDGAGTTPLASCGGSLGRLDPCEVAAAYDFPWAPGPGVNGSGERIAVIDPYTAEQTQNELAMDYAQFSQSNGLPSGGLSFYYPVPTAANLNRSGTNAGWGLEDALDIQWPHGAAPGASVEMVFSPNNGSGLYFAIDWVVAEGMANVLSMSWGEPEVGIFDAPTMPCSSGCNASTDGSFDILNPVLELAAAEGISTFAASGDCGAADGTSGLAVNFPASDAYVTGVGATDLTLSGSGGYGSEDAWSGNSSGDVGSGCQNQGGSGGGFSILPRPWWQTGPGTVPSEGRGVPDVAIVGGLGSPVGIQYSNGEFTELEGVSGTSVSTPIWAGIAAMADQAAGAPLGLLNPSLYRVLSGPNYTKDFHEITVGSNGYPAGPGWNPVTGIGTPIVAALVPALVRTPLGLSSLSSLVYASPRFGPAPLAVTVTASTHGGSGSYALQGVYFGDGNASDLSGGFAHHTFVDAGVYMVQSYTVDSSGNTTASPPVVVVVGSGGPLSVVLNATNLTPAAGTPVTFLAQVSGASGPFVYNFSFGDGSFLYNVTTPSAVHAYPAAGSFCAEVVVQTMAREPSAGASLRLPLAVGGAPSPACGNPSQPLRIVANATVTVRDAPADFPDLLTAAGGATAPNGLQPQVGYASQDPYTAACRCAILRTPGRYTLTEWVNDTVDGEATASVNVTVLPPLEASFAASLLSGPAPLAVTFSAASPLGLSTNVSGTQWTFGNGQRATGPTARATYTRAGEYVAIASLSDTTYGNASEAFLVDAEPTGSAALGVVGTVSPAVNVSSGQNVTWTGAPAGANASEGSTVLFDLGNGGSAFGPTAVETYFAPSDLPSDDTLVASVALDVPGLAPLLQVPVRLPGFFAQEAAGLVPAVNALELSESLGPLAGHAALTITGNATASGPGGVELSWTFGEGGEVLGANVSHTYLRGGGFTVAVLADDPFDDGADRLTAVVVTGNVTATLPGAVLGQILAGSVAGGVLLAGIWLWTVRPRPEP